MTAPAAPTGLELLDETRTSVLTALLAVDARLERDPADASAKADACSATPAFARIGGVLVTMSMIARLRGTDLTTHLTAIMASEGDHLPEDAWRGYVRIAELVAADAVPPVPSVTRVALDATAALEHELSATAAAIGCTVPHLVSHLRSAAISARLASSPDGAVRVDFPELV